VAQEIVEVPLTGKIIKIEVKEGDKVKEGDTLVILESMKMENPIVSTVNGTVTKLSVSSNQVVKTGDTVAIIDY